MTVEIAAATLERTTGHSTARPAGPRHREEPAARALRLPRTTRRRAAVVLAVVVALGGIGSAAAAATAAEHLGAPKHLRIAPKHLTLAPKHLALAPKHLALALAPKHLAPQPAPTDPAVPAAHTAEQVSHHSGTRVWWPWAGVLHGAFTTRTRTGAKAWTVQQGEVVSLAPATSTLVVRFADGFVGSGPATGTATLVQVTGSRPTPSGAPSPGTPSDPPSGGGTTA